MIDTKALAIGWLTVNVKYTSLEERLAGLAKEYDTNDLASLLDYVYDKGRQSMSKDLEAVHKPHPQPNLCPTCKALGRDTPTEAGVS